ncbi:MAG: polysaccharide biosynthesis protein, partial [Methanophagales archaeon]|nr:polysaccharide biosynthesis protein [Methanophagales archaeon]
IKREIIGTKLGEKLYEELMTEDESEMALESEDIFIIFSAMKKMSDIDKSSYPSFSSAEVKAYTSKDEQYLSNAEIREILYEENLLL